MMIAQQLRRCHSYFVWDCSWPETEWCDPYSIRRQRLCISPSCDVMFRRWCFRVSWFSLGWFGKRYRPLRVASACFTYSALPQRSQFAFTDTSTFGRPPLPGSRCLLVYGWWHDLMVGASVFEALRY